MVKEHLTDDELQEYTLDQAHCAQRIRDHVQACADCRARAASYALLFSGLRQQPAPAFDFPVGELVLAQIAPPKRKHFPDGVLVSLLLLAGLLFMGLLVFVNYRHFSVLMESIAPIVIYLIGTTGLVMLSFLVFDAYRSYQKKINLLDVT